KSSGDSQMVKITTTLALRRSRITYTAMFPWAARVSAVSAAICSFPDKEEASRSDHAATCCSPSATYGDLCGSGSVLHSHSKRTAQEAFVTAFIADLAAIVLPIDAAAHRTQH